MFQMLLPGRALALTLLLAAPLLASPTAATAASAEPKPGANNRIELWPQGSLPAKPVSAPAQRIVERSSDPVLPDRYIENVYTPYMVVYRPQRPNGNALLVLPGGGYQRVVLDKEGTALVPRFADEAGYTLFVLRYRLPGTVAGDRGFALADAQRALRLIRAGASQWGIHPDRVGVMGFSAGGHLAARLSTATHDAYPAVDAADRLSARPDYQLLIYPVIDMGPRRHVGSRDRLLGPNATPPAVAEYSMQNHVSANQPPAFLVHAQDDTAVTVHNSLLYYDALLQHHIPTEMHLYPRGGHGFGVRGTDGLTAASWPSLALDWIKRNVPEHRP